MPGSSQWHEDAEWNILFGIPKRYRNMDVVSRALEFVVQHLDENPSWVPIPENTNYEVVEDYFNRIKTGADHAIREILRSRKQKRFDSLHPSSPSSLQHCMIPAVNCGIVGLPNVGKSTIFSALTAAPAEAANYPFSTIDPNVGIVEVQDSRLYQIHRMILADKRIPATTEFVDIAGLVKGASKGEGLGNQFLANIRSVGIIAHVVRCFEDDDVVHVDGKIDPASDIEAVNLELALADLQSVEKRIGKNVRQIKTANPKTRQDALVMQTLLEKVAGCLGEGRPVRSMELSVDEERRLRELFLITAKKQIYVCNVDEDGIAGDSRHVQAVKDTVEKENAETVILSGKLEADIAGLDDPEERAIFLEESGIAESGLSRLIRSAYSTLGLRTFFTVGGPENRAWTFRDGATAPECAGIIHSDFERGFIKADVYNCDDLFELGSESAVRSAGKLRMEGKEYLVRDGDILHFKFNV